MPYLQPCNDHLNLQMLDDGPADDDVLTRLIPTVSDVERDCSEDDNQRTVRFHRTKTTWLQSPQSLSSVLALAVLGAVCFYASRSFLLTPWAGANLEELTAVQIDHSPFEEEDANKDGNIEKPEFVGLVSQHFASYDSYSGFGSHVGNRTLNNYTNRIWSLVDVNNSGHLSIAEFNAGISRLQADYLLSGEFGLFANYLLRMMVGSCQVNATVMCNHYNVTCAGGCCPDGSTCPSADNALAGECTSTKHQDCTLVVLHACKVGRPVLCPGSAEMCAGSQCCADETTCPSANNSHPSHCVHPKTFDCIATQLAATKTKTRTQATTATTMSTATTATETSTSTLTTRRVAKMERPSSMDESASKK